ncbi:copper resistance protein CopC [Sandarakinorhabdus cyanobacteriorum]|nr:copper resistance protein CopC [Sandarakinorhabdus cyanobacteriorum]
MMRRHLIALFTLVAAQGTAVAHPRLLSAVPAQGSTVAPLREISLGFSEAMVPAMTSVTLSPADGGAALAGTLRMAGDGRSLTYRLAAPLPPGRYRLVWKAVGADTHKVSGQHEFAVR